MKQYPSISSDIIKGQDFYTFPKYDGSNIRCEWNRKSGVYKFGTKTRLLDETDFQFPDAPGLIREKYEKDIADICKENRYDSAVFFFEYYGDNSFAGYHNPSDEKTVTLIDVNVHKRGLLPPKEFVKTFGKIDIAPVIYFGKINQDIIDEVRAGKFAGMTFEGVVCKAINNKKPGLPTMFKIKHIEWYNRLKGLCKDDTDLFNQLA